MTEKRGPPPVMHEWHDNIEAAEASAKLADVHNIVHGLQRVLRVSTSRGDLLFKKVAGLRLVDLSSQYEQVLRRAGETMGPALDIMHAKPPEDWTPDEWKTVLEWGAAGRPWSMALTHASLVKPEMSLTTWYEFAGTLQEGEIDAILQTVAEIYSSSQESKNAVKRLIRVAGKYGMRIDENLTLQNAPADLLQLMNEAEREDQEKDAN